MDPLVGTSVVLIRGQPDSGGGGGSEGFEEHFRKRLREANRPNFATADVKIPVSQDQPACFNNYRISGIVQLFE